MLQSLLANIQLVLGVLAQDQCPQQLARHQTEVILQVLKGNQQEDPGLDHKVMLVIIQGKAVLDQYLTVLLMKKIDHNLQHPMFHLEILIVQALQELQEHLTVLKLFQQQDLGVLQ